MVQPVPYYDEFLSRSLLNKNELFWLSVLIYIATSIYLCQFAMTIYNTYAFLYKQKKYKTVPLLIFYILTYLLTIFRIAFVILTLGNKLNEIIFLNFAMPLTKINMGFNQCWTLVELAIRVHLSLKLGRQEEFLELQYNETQYNEGQLSQLQMKYEWWMSLGRRIITVFVALLCISGLTFLAVEQATLVYQERLDFKWIGDTITAYSCYFAFVLLTASVTILINRLIKVRDTMVENSQEEQKSFFDNEIRTLMIILSVFDISYLLRGIWN